MRGSWKSGLTFGVAVALHAAAIAAVRLVTPGSTPSTRPIDDTVAIEGTIETVTDPRAVPTQDEPPAAPPQNEPATSTSPTTPDPQRAVPSPVAGAVTGGAPVVTGGDGATAAEGPTGAPIAMVRADIGLGRQTFLKPGALPEPAGPSGSEAPRAGAQAAMWKTARDRDTELGLGPEGPVLRALMDETRATATPTRGRAVFMAVADASGTVTSVDVVAYSGDGGGWSNAAKQALAALKGKKLRLPSAAKGAELLIEISSDRRMPSGHHAGADVSLFNIPLKRGDGPQATRVDIIPLLPKIVQVPVDGEGKVAIPLPMIDFTILGVAGDPADIGAKVQRVVHSRLVGSRIL